MPSQARFTPADSVVARELGGELVLMDLSNGEYFGLNVVGTRIWQGIEAGEPIEEICVSVSQEYSIDVAKIEADIEELLEDLLKRGLIAKASESTK